MVMTFSGSVPKYHYLMNRGAHVHRRIKNFDDVVEATKQRFPDIEWTILQDFTPTVKQTAQKWAEIKLLFTITGSNLVKAFFMTPKTVIVDMQLNFNDFTMQSVAICSYVHIVVFSLPKYNHHHTQAAIAPVEMVLYHINIGLFVLKNQKWPNKNELSIRK